MIESLNQASQQLCAALDHYISVCTFVRDSCVSGSINNNPEFYKHLEREWDQSLDYKTKLAEAQTAINVTRNTRPKTIVSSLPPEVLIQIFSLLLGYKSCSFIPRHQYYPLVAVGGKHHFLYPDTLSHVCSSWRQLTIGLPHFWTHIDLILNHPLNPGFFARAKTCAIRAGNTPLRIHICDTGNILDSFRRKDKSFELGTPRRDPSTMYDFRFLPSLPADIGSLEVDFAPQQERLGCHTASLEYFLGNCKPGVFTCYSMKDGGQRFLETTDSPQVQGSRLLKIPRRQLEEVWLRTTSLRINGTCPPWNSQAYHGLTELRLDQATPPIRESQLVNVLRWSPKLRVFHLRAGEIRRSAPLNRSVEPVRLEDLEELDIKEDFDATHTYGTFLRWITPGPKSLQLIFCGFPDEEGLSSFCARSNITRLYLEYDDLGGFDNVMLHHSPRLEFLGLNATDIEEVGLDLMEPNTRQRDEKALETCIDTLYLFGFCLLSFHEIQDVVKRYSVKHLIVRSTSIAYRTGQRQKETGNLQEVESVLSTLQPLPTIECLTARSLLDPEYWADW